MSAFNTVQHVDIQKLSQSTIVKSGSAYITPATTVRVSHSSCSSNSTPIFGLDLHFHPNYRPAKFHVCTSNSCNSIMLTRFCWLSKTNKQTLPKITTTDLVVHILQDTSRFVDTHAQPHTLRQTRLKQYQLTLSRLVTSYWSHIPMPGGETHRLLHSSRDWKRLSLPSQPPYQNRLQSPYVESKYQ